MAATHEMKDGQAMLVADLMSTPAVSIRADAPVEDAVALLGARHISAVPVVDASDRVIGIVSEADVLRQRLPADPRAQLRPAAVVDAPERTVSDVMSADPTCVSAHSDAAEAAQIMVRSGWKSLPVVGDSGRLQGVVSRSDIIRSMTRPDQDLQEDVDRAFAEAGHPEWSASVHSGHVTVAGADGPVEAALAVAATVEGVRGVRLAP
jgi:CBS domain-containing protein